MQQNQSEITLKVKAEYQNLLQQFNHLLDIPRTKILNDLRTLASQAEIDLNIPSILKLNESKFFSLFHLTINDLNNYFDKYISTILKNSTTDGNIISESAKKKLIAQTEFVQSFIIHYQKTHPNLFHHFHSNTNSNINNLSHSNINISAAEKAHIINQLENLASLLEIELQKDIDLDVALIFSESEDRSKFFSLFQMSEAEMSHALEKYLAEDLDNMLGEVGAYDDPREVQKEVLLVIAIFKVYIKEYWSNLDNSASKTQSSIAYNRYSLSNNLNEEDDITYARDFFDQLQL